MAWIHLEDTTPVGRKDYRCRLCGLPIPAGERHVKRAGIGEGGPESVRMHAPCESLTRDWDEEDWMTCDEATFREEVLEAHREVRP